MLDKLFYRSSRLQKRLVQVGVDTSLIVISYVVAVALRLESVAPLAGYGGWLPLLVTVPITLLAFYLTGIYRTVVRYVTGRMLLSLAVGGTLSAIVMSAANLAAGAPVPRSVPGIYVILLFFLAGGARFFARAIVRRDHGRSKKPVIIYGAGDAGQQVLNALFHGREYAPVGLVDDSPSLQNLTVGGLRVHSPEQLPRLARKSGARHLLLAMPSVARTRLREITSSVEDLNLKVKTIPGMSDIVSGNAKISDLRTVTPEDLLGRDPVPPRDCLMRKNVTGKVVLVSGAGGSIGSELCRQILKQNPERLIILEQSEFGLYQIEAELRESLRKRQSGIELVPILASVQDRNRLDAVFSAQDIETVYHAAAYKHVPLIEENVIAGIRNNIFGTRTLAEVARAHAVKSFILISTDKAVRPTNVMGASKRMAELVCQALARSGGPTTFSMVRFGNVLGSSGSVIPRFRTQIEHGGPVTVTHHEINRYFMSIPEAAQLVIQAGAMASGGDVFVLDMGKPVKIFELAQSMVRLHGLTPYVVETDEDIDEAKGDIPIMITGLRKGEKLYEELLIGANPQGTEHPRIMTASEASLSQDELDGFLGRLEVACREGTIPAIREVLLEAPLGYQPDAEEIADLLWIARRSAPQGHLSVVKSAT
ncbi:polysaccharide biosynthesis protein [Roseivivax sp. GX 12232]|uniref:polysaccharide biosynthesis protein n=1 Tax=Roseivivax sp. GX 12232 TaxID=2900547 RepID=UPI001E3D7C78|nr:nucleoside-diphosphate sugar epimerase/dehydratase [Roseivivax sp. GX 12232]MCE0506907.1 polysaccharide biosynthesis protein [Roseivivax sp. GX 12232]